MTFKVLSLKISSKVFVAARMEIKLIGTRSAPIDLNSRTMPNNLSKQIERGVRVKVNLKIFVKIDVTLFLRQKVL